MDPRIHFALNCGAASCPPIRIYTPESLDFGLAAAASAFCAGEHAPEPASCCRPGLHLHGIGGRPLGCCMGRQASHS